MSTREIARGGLLAAAATAWLYFGGVMPQIGPAACLIAGAASAIPLLRRANVKTAVLLYLVTSVLGLLLTPRGRSGKLRSVSAGADAGYFPARRTVDRGKYRLYCI